MVGPLVAFAVLLLIITISILAVPMLVVKDELMAIAWLVPILASYMMYLGACNNCGP